MTTEEIKQIRGVQFVIDSGKPGKELVLIAGIHGNETCGIRAFGSIKLKPPTITSGRVTFVLGNLRAIDNGVRFVERNLNRMFRDDADLAQSDLESYEYARSRELMPLLEQADAVLDIHSSATPNSTPFVICDRKSLDLAASLGFPIVSYGWDQVEPGATDDYVSSLGKIGLCIECGYHEEDAAVARASDAITRFLAYMGVCEQESNSIINEEPRFVQVVSLHKTISDFTPSRSFDDFEKISPSTLIGTDGKSEILAPDTGVVIFVRSRKNPGEEAFIFGKEIEKTEFLTSKQE